MAKGGAVILTATLRPREAREIAAAMAGSGIGLVDSPVSGGFPGAQGGTLTMMAAGDPAVLDEVAPVMEAELMVPMHTEATAMQIFHAGKSKYPHGDNWICTRVIEEIVGAQLHRDGAPS